MAEGERTPVELDDLFDLQQVAEEHEAALVALAGALPELRQELANESGRRKKNADALTKAVGEARGEATAGLAALRTVIDKSSAEAKEARDDLDDRLLRVEQAADAQQKWTMAVAVLALAGLCLAAVAGGRGCAPTGVSRVSAVGSSHGADPDSAAER